MKKRPRCNSILGSGCFHSGHRKAEFSQLLSWVSGRRDRASGAGGTVKAQQLPLLLREGMATHTRVILSDQRLAEFTSTEGLISISSVRNALLSKQEDRVDI